MEDHPHGCFPFSTIEDTLLRHTWSVRVDYGVIVIAVLNAAAHVISGTHKFDRGF